MLPHNKGPRTTSWYVRLSTSRSTYKRPRSSTRVVINWCVLSRFQSRDWNAVGPLPTLGKATDNQRACWIHNASLYDAVFRKTSVDTQSFSLKWASSLKHLCLLLSVIANPHSRNYLRCQITRCIPKVGETGPGSDCWDKAETRWNEKPCRPVKIVLWWDSLWDWVIRSLSWLESSFVSAPSVAHAVAIYSSCNQHRDSLPWIFLPCDRSRASSFETETT